MTLTLHRILNHSARPDVVNTLLCVSHLQLDEQRVQVGRATEVILKFTNPIGAKLTDGVFRLEGPGIQKHVKIPVQYVAIVDKLGSVRSKSSVRVNV